MHKYKVFVNVKSANKLLLFLKALTRLTKIHFTFVFLKSNLLIMKFSVLFVSIFLVLLFSCQNDNEQRLIQQQKELAKTEMAFQKISNAWNFRKMNLEPQSQEVVKDWPVWHLFLTELNQKPTSSIDAFQKKAKALSRKADELLQTIPENLLSPEFKSRFTVLLTKFRSLEMYISLNDIPEQKVIGLIADINLQLASIELQINEVIRKKEIRTEQGEAEMIRLLDTSRSAKTVPKILE